MVEYAPGMRTIIRDEEWMIKKIEINNLGNKALYCVGISPLVKDKDAIFLADLEQIEIVDPAKIELVADASAGYKRSLLYIESNWRQQIPTDSRLHVGHKAAMDSLHYQLEPAAIALQRPRQRILIADTVGLGKTLEAGILMSELIARGKGKRILVVTVKSMMKQFQEEMWKRFTIPLVRLDANKIQKIRASLPSNYNPFFYYDKTIISVDTLKRDLEYARYLEEAYWDIIVIDEAQNVAERGDHQAQRARLAKRLSERSDTMIMLSATPHDGRAKSFASLMNMLDPTAIASPDDYTKKDIKGLCIRRFKKDVKDQISESFPERKVYLEECQASAKEEAAFDIFAAMQLDMDLEYKRNTGRLFKTSLEKALFSSPIACIKSIEERLRKLYKKYPQGEIKDIALLEELKAALEKITPQDFSRYQYLLQLLKDRNYGWNKTAVDDRIVIFTERIETMKFIAEQLRNDLSMSDKAIVTIAGTMSEIEQQDIVEQFGRTDAKLRILVASDVASEGLNLHRLSHRLIHFDIPWSLMVFQQRNGRIDRYGQKIAPDIRYLTITCHNQKINGDKRYLEILVEKEKQAYKNIGDPMHLAAGEGTEDSEKQMVEAIEGKVDLEIFAGFFDNDDEEAENIEQLLARDATDMVNVKTVNAETIYKDSEFLEAGIKQLSQREEYRLSRLETEEGFNIIMTADMLRRLKAIMPDEALPESNTLRVSDNRAYCLEEMKKHMSQSNEANRWTDVQYLWCQHPLMHWLNDKTSLFFGRNEAPVMGIVGSLALDEKIYLASGSIPNLKSTPLVDERFGLLFKGGKFVKVLSLSQAVNMAKLRSTTLPNTGRIGLAELSAAKRLLPEAVDQSKLYLKGRFNEYQAEMQPKLEEEVNKLLELQQRRQAYNQKALANNKRRLAEMERNTDQLFDEFTKWVKDTLTIQDNPYIKIIAVLMGV